MSADPARLAAQDWDVVIAGGGNAALCAAIEAAEAGARVLILEGAPPDYRGGNSRHTRNFRCMHHGPRGPLVDTYGPAAGFAAIGGGLLLAALLAAGAPGLRRLAGSA